MPDTERELAALRAIARPVGRTARDYDPLFEQLAGCRFVLLGEASHGTHEFYLERAALTRRLILEHGFNAVAIEGDWPDAYRVNAWVRGAHGDPDAESALDGFRRFPTWLWRNLDVLEFVGWLRAQNATRAEYERTGFYGLDLYSLHASMEAVLAHLDRVDPEAARRARTRYSCFDRFGSDPQAYSYATHFALADSCEDEVVDQLVELRARSGRMLLEHGRSAGEEHFMAEQNARVVRNAEEYYRSMFGGRVASWNLRDGHMMETLGAIGDHLQRRTGRAAVVVWAHNSHLGDARATEMGRVGEINLGQLVREAHPDECYAVGFSTYAGTVTAARDWDQPAQRRRVRPGRPGSYEALFHRVGVPEFLLDLRAPGDAVDLLRGPRLQRAIGVIYRPETELQSHYFESRLLRQFDALLHFDHTRALEPVEATPEWHAGELPDTYPFGT